MLSTRLPAQTKAAYLSSIIFTAANRQLSQMTDQHDTNFQQALAEHLSAGMK